MAVTERGNAAAELGLELYRLRLSRGLSLRALARRLGMSGHGGLTDYERGQRIPPEDLVAAYERVLGLPAGELRSRWQRAVAERAAAKVADRQEVVAAQQVSPTTVARLPTDVGDFTGRTREVAELTAMSPGRIAVISGTPGVGKTTLAVHVAHLLTAEYPDAQLYCDLRGGHDPADPGDVLGTAIHALGVPDWQSPSGTEQRAALLRSLLYDRKALLVLDNAVDEPQVRSLLVGGPRCLTLITSRSRLSGLAGVHRLALDVLAPDDAVRLLAKIIGADRVDAESAVASTLTTACGLLPLAVRIAGNRLANWPDWSLGYLAARLADERDRLAWLKAGDLAARSTFAVSYDGLSAPQQHLFRLLNLVPGPDFGPQLAATAAGVTESNAEYTLDELAEASLVEPATAPGRYHLNDLLRLYAGERLRAEHDTAEQAETTDRVINWLLWTAGQASAVIAPPTTMEVEPDSPFAGDRGAALAWLDAERDNVLGAARLAADTRVITLLRTFIWYMDLRCLWRDLRELGELAQAIAPDLGSAAFAWNCCGLAASGMGEFGAAVRCHERAIELAGSAGALPEESTARDMLGMALSGIGRPADAVPHHERDLEICRQLGDRWGEASGLNHLGYTLRVLGRLAEAADCHRRAAALLRALGDARGEAMATNALGRPLTELGRFAEALDCHDRALPVFLTVGDDWATGTALHGLGVALHGIGRSRVAVEKLRQAHDIFQQVPDRLWDARTLRALGDVLADLGDDAEASTCRGTALAYYRELDAPEVEDLRRMLGEPAEGPH